MKPEKMDRRIQRTKELLINSLMNLIAEKGYESITVQNIIDEANLGRSTFYAHYNDKEHLLLSSMDEVVHSLLEGIDSLESQKKESGLPVHIISIQPIFSHAQQNSGFRKAIAPASGNSLIAKSIQKHLSSHILSLLKTFSEKSKSSGVPLEIMANYMAGTLITLLIWWLDNNMPYSPKKMENIFQSLVMPGIWENI